MSERVLVDRTDVGADGRSRDQTTGTLTPPGSLRRPFLIEKPRTVYSRLGRDVLCS